VLAGKNLVDVSSTMWQSSVIEAERSFVQILCQEVMSYGSECWAMKKVDTRQMQAAEMRMMKMMCEKTLCDGIPNGLLRDRTGVKDIENHLVQTRLR